MNIISTVQRHRLDGEPTAALAGLLFGRGATPAYGVHLPTWDDVQAAKRNEATAAAKVTEIEELLERSQAELELLRVATEQSNANWQDAETAAADGPSRGRCRPDAALRRHRPQH